MPLTIAKALAPLIAAAIRDSTGNYTGIALGTGGLCLVVAIALLSGRPSGAPTDLKTLRTLQCQAQAKTGSR